METPKTNQPNRRHSLRSAIPMSSIMTMTTLGAPSGGRSGLMGGNEASRASIAIFPLEGMSGMGSISRPVFLDLVPWLKLLSIEIFWAGYFIICYKNFVSFDRITFRRPGVSGSTPKSWFCNLRTRHIRPTFMSPI